MNTYTFTAYNTLTVHADVVVEAKTLKEAISALSQIDTKSFRWEVSDWSCAPMEASIEQVVIDDEMFSDELVCLNWESNYLGNDVWQFSEDRCQISDDIEELMEIEAYHERNQLSAAVNAELNTSAKQRRM